MNNSTKELNMCHTSHFAPSSNRFRRLTLHVLTTSIAAVLIFACAAAAAPPPPGPMVGTNLGFLSYDTGEWPFLDVFKTSSRWYRSGTCGWDCGSLELDSNGWVTELDFDNHEFAHTFIFTGVAGKMPHGESLDEEDYEYVVLYDGVGFLDYDGVEVISREVFTDAGGSHGRDVVRVDPVTTESFAISIILTARTWDPDEIVDPAEYVRNIRVVVPGFESTYESLIFHPTFLDNLSAYGVIRLMDWMDTIEGGTVSYSEYPTESSARWNQAPATIMAKLANRLEADIWVNIPHLADQSFLTGLAGDLAGALEESRKLYVEYSNETWNKDFPSYVDLAVLGCNTYPDLVAGCDHDGLPGSGTPGNGILCEDHQEHPVPACDTARIRYTSQRSVEIWAAFTTAFDNDVAGSSASRLVRVLASWSGNTALHEALLSYQDAYLSADAFAVSGYFGWSLGGDPVVRDWDVGDSADMSALFTRLSAEVDDTLDDMAADRQFLLTPGARDYSSIPLVLYEGGQGLVAWGDNAKPEHLDHVNEVFDAANRDSRMGERYRQLLDGWRLRGGDVLFNHYVNCRTYSGWGRYGALEHQRQDHSSSIKYSALMSFINSLP